jgi:biopolymer transport protein ExbD
MKRPIELPPLPPARLDIINLIDILITLIAFFLLTSVFAEKKDWVRITPPKINSRTNAAQLQRPITVGISKNNQTYYNGRLIRNAELNGLLGNQLSDVPIIIRADKDCRFEAVMKVLDILKKGGHTKIAFEVRAQ